VSTYTTLADVAAYLNVQGQGDNDLLTRLIAAASGFIDSYTGRPNGLAEAPYTDNRNGNGKSVLTLLNAPIQTVSSVIVDGVAVDPLPAPAVGVYAPSTPAYTFDESKVQLTGATFRRGVGNVSVAYTAGFFAAGSPDPQIEQACIDLVALKYKQKDRIGMTSQVLQGIGTVSFLVRDLPADLVAVLDTYRRVAYVTNY
jgi:hypothetical protein